ncbi:uncharacterized protein [Antedon mediterranea]|uniref:uncharacterized protein n=1 Tax=Antedon mediterranea TaxID=105859 RepID=UPI003AF52E55
MSSAIILPIIYERQMRRTNRRELFVKRFTSGCVVIATLFIVVGLSSATWYMTILGTLILMVVGLSGFCMKYCDRTSANRAAGRRAISISSRISSRSLRYPPNGAVDENDLPPAYDNIVFDEPYTRSYLPQITPPPPYEEIFDAANQRPAQHADPVPAYSAPRSRPVPTTIVVPRFSLNQYDRQSVCLSTAIGVTIVASNNHTQMTSDTVPPLDAFNYTHGDTAADTCTAVQRLPHEVIPDTQEVSPDDAQHTSRDVMSETSQRATHEITVQEQQTSPPEETESGATIQPEENGECVTSEPEDNGDCVTSEITTSNSIADTGDPNSPST